MYVKLSSPPAPSPNSQLHNSRGAKQITPSPFPDHTRRPQAARSAVRPRRSRKNQEERGRTRKNERVYPAEGFVRRARDAHARAGGRTHRRAGGRPPPSGSTPPRCAPLCQAVRGQPARDAGLLQLQAYPPANGLRRPKGVPRPKGLVRLNVLLRLTGLLRRGLRRRRVASLIARVLRARLRARLASGVLAPTNELSQPEPGIHLKGHL
jgi:hypothetical protein